MKRTAPHHRGRHQQVARALKRQAENDPTATCTLCGKTRDKTGPNGDGTYSTGRQIGWVAGHVRPGDPTSPYRLECGHCSAQEGADRTNQAEPKSDDWW